MAWKKDNVTSGQVDPKLNTPPKSNGKLRESVAEKHSDKLQHSPKSAKKISQEARRNYKSKFRAEKTADKLDAARNKLTKKKPKKRGTIKTVAQMAGFEVYAKAHGKIHQVEGENVSVEAAHKTELMGERVGSYVVHHAKQRHRTRPVRRVAKAERKHIKASADYRFRQMAKENPELNRNALKRFAHKKRIQRKMQKKTRETARTAAHKAGKKTASAVEKVSRAVIMLVKKHPAVAVILALGFLIILIMQSCMGSALTIMNGLAGAVGGSSYLAEDEDITEVGLRYSEWEVDLAERARDAENTHPGFDEYRYFIDAVGHDPYAMLAYLTVKHDNFTFTGVQDELQSIFNQQYTLTYAAAVETRYRWETHWDYYIDWYTGLVHWYSYDVRVPYEWRILTVTLTTQPFIDVIMPLLTEDELDRFELHMLMHGNRQYVGSPFPFNWLPYVSSIFGYRIHPISGEKSFHTGVDIGLPTGTPILAGGTGIVTQAADRGGYGLTVVIDYGNGITALYAHCSVLLVSAGHPVETGDVIALVGSTGNSTGPHLHMEIMKNGQYLNPLFFVDGTITIN
jgi:murein DD-endopeptidase MepM/ murein hydrolase activator NlpD